ncbi:MAG: DUF2723 domain-containing protein [Anaerolineae bacterium]|nr:DUF2723 domain-containing protein [Anaerolineae bacterium]
MEDWRFFSHALLPPPSAVSKYLPFFISAILFTASLALYLTTLAPSVVTLFDDSLEFQLVTYQLGIAHPTGYPLYTLLGKLFTFLPVGNVAFRVNLMSAVFGAATVALLYLLIRQVGANSHSPRINGPLPLPGWAVHLGGVGGALLLATGPVFWQQATIAEVYALNTFFVALLLLIVVTPPAPPKEHRQFYWLAFLTGLSLTHHRTMVLLLPALALYLYLTRRAYRFTWKILALGALLGLAPLLLYLYLPLRGHIGSLDGTYQNNWPGFWRQVGAGGYGTFIFDNPFDHERSAGFYWDLMRSHFYTLVPGFVGIFYLLWVGRRKILALTGLAFLTYFTFNIFYRVTDIEVFFIPVFLIWAMWSGVGATFLLQIAAGAGRAANRRPGMLEGSISTGFMKLSAWRVALTGLTLVIFGFIIFQNIRATRPLLAQRNTWHVHDYGLDILRQPFEDQAAIVGLVGEMTLIRYFQQTETMRPQVETIAADLEADRLVTVEKLLREGKSVYLTRELRGAPERWFLGAVGPLIRVGPAPLSALPEEVVPANQTAVPEITLAGYGVSRVPHTGAGPAPVRLALYWRAEAIISANLKVSARLLNQAGEIVTATDAAPVHFAYPTTAWRPGEIVSDVYDLTLPVDSPPGPYTPLLIWYDPAQNATEVGRVELKPVN